ncbi:hypothetical protein WJ968_00815 [Achromobacter xylosoxidans]
MNPQSGPIQAPSQAPLSAAAQRRAGWLLPLLLACAVYMAEGTLRMLLARQPATSLEVLGMLALPPLLVCALFSIGKRFRDPRRQLYIVLVVGLVMLLGDAGQAWSRIEQNRQRELANAGIRDAMAVLRRMAGGAEKPGALPDIDPTPRAHGAYGELERAVKTVAGQRLAQHKAYVKDLDDIGLPRLFDPGRLARDTGLVESRMILELAGSPAAGLPPAQPAGAGRHAGADTRAGHRRRRQDPHARRRGGAGAGAAARREPGLGPGNAHPRRIRPDDHAARRQPPLLGRARRTAAVRARRRPGALSEAPGPRRRPGPRTGPAGRAATGQPAAGHPALTYAAASPRQRLWSARRDSHSPVNCTIDTSAIRITITSNITRVS